MIKEESKPIAAPELFSPQSDRRDLGAWPGKPMGKLSESRTVIAVPDMLSEMLGYAATKLPIDMEPWSGEVQGTPAIHQLQPLSLLY